MGNMLADRQNTLSAHDAFHTYRQWSGQVKDLLSAYADWRSHYQLDISSIERAISHSQPQVRLVVTGEFGRGKTEFINALLAHDFGASLKQGQRLLPVQVGRTTMAPLELFYDDATKPYLKLLPIEARLQSQPLSWFRNQPDQWQHHDLDTSDAQSMRLLFQEIAKTKPVTLAVAEQLGFDIQFLESCQEESDHVLVPAWQHALINMDLPIFQQGLSIIDTPGFNALGMESMLSEDIITHGQAHLHVLSIETGVTSSDYQLWKNDILPATISQHMPVFVLLNKLDLLDQNEEPVVDSLNRIKRMGAKQLDISEKQFFGLSSKFANQALLTQDATLRKRSGFDYFYEHFFPSLVTERTKRLQHGMLQPVIQDVDNKIISHKLEIKRLTKDLGKLVNTQDDVEQNYLQTKNGIAEEEARVEKQKSLFDENMRDIELSYEHVMHIFSDKQFATHKERGMSLLSDDNSSKDIATEAAKARNVLLAGMRLDMKRIAMDITVLNNAMRALYKDLDSQFEPREISVKYFVEYIDQIETSSIKTNGSPRATFEKHVIKDLNDTFRKQRKLIATWYESHVQTVAEPMDLALANLTERKAVAKQLAHKITDRKEHLAFAQSRLPVAKEDLKTLEAIKSGLSSLC